MNACEDLLVFIIRKLNITLYPLSHLGLFEKGRRAPILSSIYAQSKLLPRIRATVSTGACGGAINGAKEEDKGSNTVKRNNCIGNGCLAFNMSGR